MSAAKFLILLFASGCLNLMSFMGIAFAFTTSLEQHDMSAARFKFLDLLRSGANLLLNFYFIAGGPICLLAVLIFFLWSRDIGAWIVRGSFALPVVVAFMIAAWFTLQPSP